ncbi:MAG TPA: potassium channel family protein [Pyrinomonadaceae bacterium]
MGKIGSAGVQLNMPITILRASVGRVFFLAKRFIRRHVVLDTRSAVAITVLWVVLSVVLEVSNHKFGLGDAARFWLSVAAASLNGVVLLFVISSLVRRLLQIIEGQRGAGYRDIIAVAFAYWVVVIAFAAVFLAFENVFGPDNAFKYSNDKDYLRLVDYIYLSGVTIGTVGYGDIVPINWYTKITVIVEAFTGLWLTVFVVAVFVGSLLGRQDLDRRTKFLTTFQRRYLSALEEHHKALDLVEKYLEEDHGGAVDYEALDRQLTEFQESILKTVADLVQLQYEPSSSATVTANWMRLYLRGEALPKELESADQFTHPDYRAGGGKILWGVLVLRDWGERPPSMPGLGEFALPVYDPNDPSEAELQLPGAPEVIGSVDGYVIVSDSSKVDFSRHHPLVRNTVARYFKTTAPDLRSFASVRIEYEAGQLGVGGEADEGAGADDQDTTILGVINIQSDEPELCGSSPEVQQLLVDIIRPFARYLAQAELYRPTPGGGTT